MTDALPTSQCVQLVNMVDRLHLEQFICRELTLRCPFLLCFTLFLVLLYLEYDSGLIFEVQSVITSHLGIATALSAKSLDDISQYYASSFMLGIASLNPLSSSFLNSSGGVISKLTEYQLATAVVGWPIIYEIKGLDKSAQCHNDSKSFVNDFDKLYPIYWACGINQNCSALGNLSNDNLVACVDKRHVNQTDQSDGHYMRTLQVSDSSYGRVPASVLLLPDEMAANMSLDVYTAKTVAVAIFYTPQVDMFTFVSVEFKVSSVGSLTPKISINSFRETADAIFLLSLMIGCLSLGLLQLAIDSYEILSDNNDVHVKGKGMRPSLSYRKEGVFHLVCGIALIGLLISKILAKLPAAFNVVVNSPLTATNFRSTLKVMLALNPIESSQAYIDAYFNVFSQSSTAEYLRIGSTVVMMLETFRLILLLAVHPRVAMLVETVRIGADDIFHYSILFFIMYSLLALIAKWSFGDQLSYFSTFSGALFMQFQMLCGSWPFTDLQNFNNQFAVFVYVAVFGIVMFFVMLNFFLAIVVDSFEVCKQEIDDYKVEESLFKDMINLLIEFVYGTAQRWPSRQIMTRALETYRLEHIEIVAANKIVSWCDIETNFHDDVRLNAHKMFMCYHQRFAHKSDCFLHPMFGKFRGLKTQMSSAIVEIESTLRVMGSDLTRLVDEVKFICTDDSAVQNMNKVRSESDRPDKHLPKVKLLIEALAHQRAVLKKKEISRLPVLETPIFKGRAKPVPKEFFYDGPSAPLTAEGWEGLKIGFAKKRVDVYDLAFFGERILESLEKVVSDLDGFIDFFRNNACDFDWNSMKREILKFGRNL